MKEAYHALHGPEPYERGLVRIAPWIYLPTGGNSIMLEGNGVEADLQEDKFHSSSNSET